MNYKKSIIGSIIAFVIATSCCWLPALIIMLGGASSMLAFAKGIEQFSGVFMAIGASRTMTADNKETGIAIAHMTAVRAL